jgi:hypothetical protein
MHLNLRWEVTREDLRYEEAVVKSSSDVLDRVGEIKGLKPLKDLSGQTGWGTIRVD